jgi:hypothetical protein
VKLCNEGRALVMTWSDAVVMLGALVAFVIHMQLPTE